MSRQEIIDRYLSISFGTANYTTANGSAGRAILVGRGWTIIDGGAI